MKLAMCNEFCEGWPIERVFGLAAATGYDGVEIAPFTLCGDVRDLTGEQRRDVVRAATASGVAVVGLHWLLVSPDGLYINHPDPEIRRETGAYFSALVQCCADMGGTKMVIGSPKQRNVFPGLTYDQAWDFTVALFEGVLPVAEACGVDLCIEPLAHTETDFITTAADGRRLCDALAHPRFRLHLDVKAMSAESGPVAATIRESAGYIGHFHANDANRGYPGAGDTAFEPIMAALTEVGYEEWVSVEVFDFSPGPEAIARESIRTLRGALGD